MGRARPRPHRPDLGRPGHLGREHRAAGHRRVAAPGQQRPAVAGHRLPAALRRRSAARRPHRRPGTATPGVPDRHDHLHRRVPVQRLREQRRRAHRRPRHPGPRRRPHDASRSVVGDDHVLRRSAHPRPSPVGCGRQPRYRRRRPVRWRAHHLVRLAAHLLGQRPHRRRRPRRRAQGPPQGRHHPCGPAPSSTFPVRSPSSAASAPSCTASPPPPRTAGCRPAPWSRSPPPPSCSPRSSASSVAQPARWSRRTPGRLPPWCPAPP